MKSKINNWQKDIKAGDSMDKIKNVVNYIVGQCCEVVNDVTIVNC